MTDTGGEGAAATEIKALQDAIATRDRALEEALLRADENAAEVAAMRRLFADQEAALAKSEALIRQHAIALDAARQKLDSLRSELAFLRVVVEKDGGLAEAVNRAETMSARLETALTQRAEADAALSRAQQTVELQKGALEAAGVELAALRRELAIRDEALAGSGSEPITPGGQRDAAIRHRVNLITSYRGYNFVELDDDVVALRQDLGPMDLTTEKLGDRDLPPFVLRSETADRQMHDAINALQQKIDDLLGS